MAWPKGGGGITQWSQHINHSLKPFNECFERCGLLILFFFIKSFIYNKFICVLQLLLKCLLVARKENLTGVSTGLTGQSKNLDPTGNLTYAGRPDRFPCLGFN